MPHPPQGTCPTDVCVTSFWWNGKPLPVGALWYLDPWTWRCRNMTGIIMQFLSGRVVLSFSSSFPLCLCVCVSVCLSLSLSPSLSLSLSLSPLLQSTTSSILTPVDYCQKTLSSKQLSDLLHSKTWNMKIPYTINLFRFRQYRRGLLWDSLPACVYVCISTDLAVFVVGKFSM